MMLQNIPLIIAHRGGKSSAVENTLNAFKNAWNDDVDGIEGDFRKTKDDILVCNHDSTVKKIFGSKKRISTTYYKDLKSINGTMLTTLKELLPTVAKNKKIYIEIKKGLADIDLLVQILQNKPREIDDNQIVMISFSKEAIKMFKSLTQMEHPEYNAYLLYRIKTRSMTNDQLIEQIDNIKKLAQECNADGLSTNFSKKFVKYFQDYNQWHVWTINKLEDAIEAHKAGVVSITTDIPEEIKATLIKQII